MTVNWVPSNAFSIVPPHAVIAGHDIDGSAIYVGRAEHNGDLIPAKAIPSKHIAYIPYGGGEIAKPQYEVLCMNGFDWIGSANGHVPADAVCAGSQNDCEALYVGRASVGGSTVTGKVQRSHNCIYVPFDGREHSFSQYEVLVAKPVINLYPNPNVVFMNAEIKRPVTWVPSSIHSPLPIGAILGGHDQDRSRMYIGRAWHEGDQLPAKVLPDKNACYVAYGGREILKEHFEVLCNGNITWIPHNPGTRMIPPSAVAGGQTSNGETLYIGRVEHEGSLTVGKLHLTHGALYIPFGGSEVPIYSGIEVLIEH